MQNLNLDQVCFIIVKAREYDAQVPPDDPEPGSNPIDSGELDVLEDQPGDAVDAELEAALKRLTEGEMAELMALLWIGRGDYTAEDDDWETAVAEAHEELDSSIVRTLMEIPLLGDHLENGLGLRGFSCED